MTTRERIVETACKMFIQSGVRNVTMSDIAGHLGISKRTIYEHVANKEELIEECVIVLERANKEEISKLDVGGRAIDKIKFFIDISTGIIKSDLGVFFMEVKKFHPAVFAKTIGKHREERLENTVEFIKKGVDDGFFLEYLDARLMALLVSNMFTTFEKNDDLFGLEKEQMPGVFASIFLTLCRGMATQSGVEEIDQAFNIK